MAQETLSDTEASVVCLVLDLLVEWFVGGSEVTDSEVVRLVCASPEIQSMQTFKWYGCCFMGNHSHN